MTQHVPAAGTGKSALPWTADDFLRWALFTAAGAIMIGVAWYQAGGQPTASEQMGPVNLAVGGAVVAAVGHIFWFLRGRRAIGERRRALLGEPPRESRAGGVATRAGVAGSERVVLVAGAGQKHYHRANCALAAGRSWPAAGQREHEAAGRTPCGVCRP